MKSFKNRMLCPLLFLPGVCILWVPGAMGQELSEFDSVRVGMSLTELVQARPLVKPAGPRPRSKSVDLTKTDQELTESNLSGDLEKLLSVLRGDAGSGLFFVGKYTIKNSKLVSCQLVWTGNERTIASGRKNFFDTNVARFGGEFKRDVMESQAEGVTKGVHAPFLLWEGEGQVVTVVSVPPRKLGAIREAQAALMLAMSAKEGADRKDPDPSSLSEEEKAKLYEAHDVPAPSPEADQATVRREGRKPEGNGVR